MTQLKTFRLIALILVPLIIPIIANPTSFVNPFIGTGGFGAGVPALYPGAQIPFGFARVSPDTSTIDPLEISKLHAGGYFYPDTHIRRISHTHMVGPGVVDLGALGLLPVSQAVTDEGIKYPGGMFSEFSHDSEKASPGYYSVELQTYGILAEVTATQHAGVHRYTYPKDAENRIVLVDVGHSIDDKSIINASLAIDARNLEITGSIHQSGSLTGRFGGYDLYFVIYFNSPFSDYGTWKNGVVHHGNSAESGCGGLNYGVGGFVSFDVDIVDVVVGMSLISIDHARNNVEHEVSDMAFDQVADLALDKWNQYLNRVSVSSNDSVALTTFYTMLYHAHQAPTNYTESDGQYVGFDKKLHRSDDTYFSDMSIWDQFRTQMPLMSLIQPMISRHVCESLVSMLKYGGDLPRWPFFYGYTGCMDGAHATIVLTDAYLKGITDWDVSTAYEGARAQAMGPRPHGPSNIELFNQGYVPMSVQHSAAKTLEYAYDDGVLSFWAKALGFEDDARLFAGRGQFYKNIFNNDTMFFCGRHENTTVLDCTDDVEDLLDPRFIEGDARHWRWFVPHDIDGLVDLFGNAEYFHLELKKFIDDSKQYTSKWIPNPAYWAGNEPDILAPWLFNYVGRLDTTAESLRYIMSSQYSTMPDGVPGNDDYGTLSAWYVWAALGLYPVSGKPEYLLGSPIFESVEIDIPDAPITITARNTSSVNIYVQSVTLNGVAVPMSRPIIAHEDLVKQGGSVLEFVMGSNPP